MLSFGEFSAWVSIDGVEAEEYGVTVDGTRVTCWIASEANKTFSLHWKDSVVSSPTRGNPSIDGTTYPPRYTDTLRRNHVFLGGVRDSDSSKRPFMFTKLNLTDDDAYLDVVAPPSLGEIEVALYRVERRRSRNHRPPLNNISQGADLTRRVYHEHNKKGIDHEASLGAPRHIDSINRSQHKSYYFTKPRDDPIVTFRFKYRPLDVLQAQDIAPRPQPVRETSALKPDVKDIIVIEDEEIEFLYMRVNKAVKDDNNVIDLSDPDSRDVMKLDEEHAVFPRSPQQNNGPSGSQAGTAPEIKDEYSKPFGLSNVYFDLTV
ncbi:uncharacterized protein BT62DRAFT_1071981 [Guyanagaster necrorhizus]|uniref:DUF7918 domain-containing protein n=1 Tax=Guyanagaster necrorhizus TaxID=856835 RepID=A0A9P8AXA6_9AGAR|nr:uncharacterized protein BT62DRAFT_1071981 [Guyanagaster necrorhizus MCA 3950]KAG7451413.1 hypothetical protein BT62DRAFT_1071981 [Guyanagaster necrorhizus MCA 3950]